MTWIKTLGELFCTVRKSHREGCAIFFGVCFERDLKLTAVGRM